MGKHSGLHSACRVQCRECMAEEKREHRDKEGQRYSACIVPATGKPGKRTGKERWHGIALRIFHAV